MVRPDDDGLAGKRRPVGFVDGSGGAAHGGRGDDANVDQRIGAFLALDQHVAGFAGGEVDPHPALGAFEFDYQAVAGITLHIADHETRALALAAREQVHQHGFELIEQAVAQIVLVVAPLEAVGCVVEVEEGMWRHVDRVNRDGAHWVCSPSSRALNQSPLARTQ